MFFVTDACPEETSALSGSSLHLQSILPFDDQLEGIGEC